MALDDVVDTIANALRASSRRQREIDETLGALRARVDALVDVLVAKDVLTVQHQRHLDRCSKNESEPPKRVRLAQYIDKYTMEHGDPVDCADRIPLCKARCCTFAVTLTEQDLDEGKLQWNLDDPYVLRRDNNGRCVYQDRASGGCTNYEHRPATCRSYSCKDDRRIWIDFENKVPAEPRMTMGADDLIADS
jgi:hypothetical protein